MAVINLPTMEQFDEMNDYLAIMATHIGTDKIGTQTYTDNNYVTDGQSVTASIDALDMAVKNNAEQISTNVGNLEAHINDKDNPHEVTAAQVGALSTTDAGDLAELTTTEKGSLVGAINEIQQLVSTMFVEEGQPWEVI